MKLKPGDLVRPRRGPLVGVIVKYIDEFVPRAVVVLWNDGEFTEEWADELEAIDEA